MLRGKPLNLPQPPPIAQEQPRSSANASLSQSAQQQKQPGDGGLQEAASKTAEALQADSVGGVVLAGAQQAQQQQVHVLLPLPAVVGVSMQRSACLIIVI